MSGQSIGMASPSDREPRGMQQFLCGFTSAHIGFRNVKMVTFHSISASQLRSLFCMAQATKD